MYFQSRSAAGEVIASKLLPYRYENCAVVALSYNSVLVAEPIAASLHALLGLFIIEKINIPGEGLTYGTVDHTGGFSYNHAMSEGERDDYYGEYHSYIEEQKRSSYGKINRLMASGGMIDPSVLREHVVIVVADGIKDSQKLDAISDFLKPIKVKRLIVATPIASISAVDRMHILADEIHCLAVTENFFNASHYYDTPEQLSHEQAVEKVKNIVLKWR